MTVMTHIGTGMSCWLTLLVVLPLLILLLQLPDAQAQPEGEQSITTNTIIDPKCQMSPMNQGFDPLGCIVLAQQKQDMDRSDAAGVDSGGGGAATTTLMEFQFGDNNNHDDGVNANKVVFQVQYRKDLSDGTIESEGFHGTELPDFLTTTTDRTSTAFVAGPNDAATNTGEVNMVVNRRTGITSGAAHSNGKIIHFWRNDRTGEVFVEEMRYSDLPPDEEGEGGTSSIDPPQDEDEEEQAQGGRHLRHLGSRSRSLYEIEIENSVNANANTGDPPPFIDVLVAYTKRCYCNLVYGESTLDCGVTEEGLAIVKARIELAFLEANTALSNSGMESHKLRMIYVNGHGGLVEEQDYDEHASGSFQQVLGDVAHARHNQVPQPLQSVHRWRDQYGADAVSLWIDLDTNCGLAYAGNPTSERWAFSVVHYKCATGYYSFVHELAHLLGAEHDRQTQGCPAPGNQDAVPVIGDAVVGDEVGLSNANTPSPEKCCDKVGQRCETYGWRGDGYRSIMSYGCSANYDPNNVNDCPRLQYFSQPDPQFWYHVDDPAASDGDGAGVSRSLPMGDAYNNNVGTLKANWNKLAAHREEVVVVNGMVESITETVNMVASTGNIDDEGIKETQDAGTGIAETGTKIENEAEAEVAPTDGVAPSDVTTDAGPGTGTDTGSEEEASAQQSSSSHDGNEHENENENAAGETTTTITALPTAVSEVPVPTSHNNNANGHENENGNGNEASSTNISENHQYPNQINEAGETTNSTGSTTGSIGPLINATTTPAAVTEVLQSSSSDNENGGHQETTPGTDTVAVAGPSATDTDTDNATTAAVSEAPTPNNEAEEELENEAGEITIASTGGTNENETVAQEAPDNENEPETGNEPEAVENATITTPAPPAVPQITSPLVVAASLAAPSCGNGVCEGADFGEKCNTCPNDCIGGTFFAPLIPPSIPGPSSVSASVCGNGICEQGELCHSCPTDCAGRIELPHSFSQAPLFCCMGGPVETVPNDQGFSGCDDPYCNFGVQCDVSDKIALLAQDQAQVEQQQQALGLGVDGDGTTFCCGDGVCEMVETIENCATDCPCNNDGICNGWETMDLCPKDNCDDAITAEPEEGEPAPNDEQNAMNTTIGMIRESECLDSGLYCEGIFPDPCCSYCNPHRDRCL
jgi:hypothetical protein